jgi:hypothetical protein
METNPRTNHIVDINEMVAGGKHGSFMLDCYMGHNRVRMYHFRHHDL